VGVLPAWGRPAGWDPGPGSLSSTFCDFCISAMTIISTTPAGANGNGHATNGHRPPTQRPGQPGVIQLLREAGAAERQQAATPQSPAWATKGPSGGGFRPEQIAALSAPLDRARISSREQGRGRVNYLQGWVLIEEANRIFGHDGWQRQTLSCQCVTQAQRLIGSKSEGRPQKEGWGVTYIARVRITVNAGERGLLIREGTGAGHGIDVDLGLAHESAIKEAETDAMKRALVTFGNPFGLALYDKSQRQVSGAPAQQTSQAANGVVRRPQGAAAPVAQPPADPAPHAPLDPPTIRSLQDRIRGLLPPQLAAFSRAFRSAFQVPESTPSIAGLITEQRHRAWIQQYLAQGLGQGLARTA
jgi:hypothetical protein